MLGSIVSLAFSSSGCALLAWNCLRQQKTGQVTSLAGRVEAGQIVSHVVPYDQQGSQNDVRIVWERQGASDGPRIWVYAIRRSCPEFSPPPRGSFRFGRGACDEIGHAAGTLVAAGQFVQRSIIVPGGPDNGAPDLREYTLFVVGDPRQAVAYSISITWFRGPDC
jgi:hypothetical protein